MTRSEEQLDVNKRTRQVGTARLRKWIETEDVEIHVPVQREGPDGHRTHHGRQP